MHWLIFLEKKIEIYFSTNIRFNQFFQSYKLKKKQYIIFNIKKVRGDAKLRKNEGVLLHLLYVHC